MRYHVFNGDADGLCARQQLQLAEGDGHAQLVTGPKREIHLLDELELRAGDAVTVLDISLDSNRERLLALLDEGVKIRWFDHHHAGEIPQHAGLEAQIDITADTCTSLIVNQHIGGEFRDWAVVGAFGDNLHDAAIRAAEPLQLGGAILKRLEELGTLLNYNGYGAEIGDLHFHPAELARRMAPYRHPQDFLDEDIVRLLRRGYADDMASIRTLEPLEATEQCAVYLLPEAAWARRAQGVFANEMARQHPLRAHALLSTEGKGYRVSVRAPLATKRGADSFCLSFPTGGGRSAAAGIKHLPASETDKFLSQFRQHFSD